jgi:hypothetical protein
VPDVHHTHRHSASGGLRRYIRRMEREYSSGTRRRAVLAAAAGLFGGITSTLAQGIYLQSFSAASTRYAVLEDDGYVAICTSAARTR